MIKRLDNIKLNINENEDKLVNVARKKLGGSLKYFKILKKSLDARDKNNLFWVYSIAFSDEEQERKSPPDKLKNAPPVVIIGGGPAGLFCAVRLIERGFKPIIIERGESVEKRRETITDFFSGGRLNVNSNVQFGEGGAGTFSDGKLNTQTRDGLNKDVLETFFRFGAPEEILYLNKPHIGSDNLFYVLQNIRKFVTENGGKYLFNTVFERFYTKNGRISSILVKNTVTGEEEEIFIENVVLALGHSARDTFKMLNNSGVAMQPRDFAIGVRIEHIAEEISRAQYGEKFRLLPTADYKFVSHAHERTVFTFCMCPGGVVIPSASEEGGVVTNGMSLYSRKGTNSNSALMVQMKAEDWGGGLFGGMEFQRKIENAAFVAGGSNYKAPVQLYGDFAKDRISSGFRSVVPTYSAGITFAPISEILPKVATDALKAAISDIDKRLKGFAADDAVLTAVESRFSSPVRILRDAETFESLSVKGLYPCGEGSGYSGGITSSAADGLKIAEIIYGKYRNFV
ncbi:MAG: FAD-binding protein [Clostridia bacterium]|nr:FAD-binding protein [Clostridia bacterium]